MRLTLPIVAVSILGCSGLFGPHVELSDLRGGPCGTIEGGALRGGPFAPGTVPLFIDEALVAPLEFTSDWVEFQRPASPGGHTVRADGPTFEVDVPPYDLGVDWGGWVMPPRQGDPVTIDLRVVGHCPRDGVRLHADLPASGRSVAKGEPLAAGPVHRLDLGPLPAGRHELVLRLEGAHGLIETRTVRVEVAAPCTDTTCSDRDGDGFDAVARGGNDCDDTNPSVHPGARGLPDPDGDGATVHQAIDIDCDGVIDTFAAPYDCAEGDPTIPRPEDPLPTGVDEDCDGLIDEGTTAYDDDGDGFSEEQGDCNDADVAVSPSGVEIGDCKDNDCDGRMDEGVQRSNAPDRFEPNDDRPFVLEGAQPRRGPFGGYRPTRDDLPLTIADVHDAETFLVYAHDGSGDTFHVTVRLASAGDGLSYAVRIEGPTGSTEEVLSAGGELRLTGRAFDDDSGNYRVRIVPEGETPDACPLQVELSSG